MIRRGLLVMAALAALAALGGSAEAAKVSQVYISEVLYNPVGPDGGNQLIELVNRGPTAQSLNPWSICIQFLYKNFPVGASIAAGGRYTIHVNANGSNTPTDWYTGIGYVNIDVASDAITLYHTTSGFATAGNLEDIVEFGAGGQPRENVGVAAGFWTAGTFVPLGVEGQSLQFVPAGNPPATRHPISDYCNAAPTIGAANSCGPPPMGRLSDLLITEILNNPVGPESGATSVEIVNTATLPVSLDSLTLVVGSASYMVPFGLSLPAGGLALINLNGAGAPVVAMAPRATEPPDLTAHVVINATPFVDLEPLAGSVALYKNSLNFEDPVNLVDFVQWGAPGQSHENLAAAAGIWTIGDFFPEVVEGSSIQWAGTNEGNSSGDFCADAPTLGSVNLCTSSGLPGGGQGGGAVLAANRPNPFNGATYIRFVTTRPEPDARLTVFDLSGRSIRHLFRGALGAGMVEMSWDSRDDSGSPVPAGIYFYRLVTAAGTQSRKMTVFR